MPSLVKSIASSVNATTTQSASTPIATTKAVSIPSKVPPRSCFQSIVTVEVGTGETAKAFHIHKGLLIFFSDYFRGAFNGSFIEATTGKISLADERVDVFDVVNQFIYTRQLSDEADHDMDWNLLVRAWIFGDKYLIPCLQNRVMDVLCLKMAQTNIVPTSQIKLVYNSTVPGSPLRKSLVDVLAYRVSDFGNLMQTNEVNKHWCYEALTDLVKAMGAKKNEEVGVYKLPEANRHKCYYHVHNDGEQC